MKLSPDAVIAYEKVGGYLLEWRAENDKSLFLARAGYTKKDFERLANDIREQLLSLDANYEESTEYGEMYSITGWIQGPNGTRLKVVSIWMIEAATEITKFVTLYPARDR